MNPVEKDHKQVNGIRMYYEIYGSGKPLVLIHGGGGSILFDLKKLSQDLKTNFS